MPRKLMIIGASALQLPAIRKAKQMGLYVGVADYNPHAVGVAEADCYFNASTVDEDAICRAAEMFRPDGIMTLATDMPMRSIAKAAALLGLPGISYDTAVKATDKFEMIRAFEEHGVSSPWYHIISDMTELKAIGAALSYPCIVKPTDNSGSRGVSLVRSEPELLAACEYGRRQSRSGRVIVEEYLTGSEVSVEIMVVNGRIEILAVTDKLTTGAPHFVEMGHSQPSRFTGRVLREISDLAEQAVRAVGITNSPAHVEMMITERGPVMIELGARMGGDYITTHLVPLSTGIDMIKATIDVALGNDPDLSSRFSKGSAIRFLDIACGRIDSVEGVDDAMKMNGVMEIAFAKNVGDIVSDITSSVDRVGAVIAQGDNAVDAVAICERAIEAIEVTVS